VTARASAPAVNSASGANSAIGMTFRGRRGPGIELDAPGVGVRRALDAPPQA